MSYKMSLRRQRVSEKIHTRARARARGRCSFLWSVKWEYLLKAIMLVCVAFFSENAPCERNLRLFIPRFLSKACPCRSFRGTFRGINDSAKRHRRRLHAVVRENAVQPACFCVCHCNDPGRRSSRKSRLGRSELSGKKYAAVVYKR